MSEESTTKPATSFWIIASLMLAWNAIGVWFYYQQSLLTEAIMADAGMTAQQIAHIVNTPTWGHMGYAVAVFAGLLGAISLLMRRSWAPLLFMLSLAGALLQDLDAFVLRDALDAWGSSSVALPLIVIAICVAEILYSRNAQANGTLN